jgi:hypothetical protein
MYLNNAGISLKVFPWPYNSGSMFKRCHMFHCNSKFCRRLAFLGLITNFCGLGFILLPLYLNGYLIPASDRGGWTGYRVQNVSDNACRSVVPVLASRSLSLSTLVLLGGPTEPNRLDWNDSKWGGGCEHVLNFNPHSSAPCRMQCVTGGRCSRRSPHDNRQTPTRSNRAIYNMWLLGYRELMA